MEQSARLIDLISGIYEGATSASRWHEVVSSIADWMGVSKSLLLTPWLLPERGGFVFSHGITQQQIDLWQSRYQPEDLRARRLVERGLIRNGQVFLGHELVAPDELLASQWWKDFLSRLDLFHQLGAVILDQSDPLIPGVVLNCYRGRGSEPFDDAHRQQLALLVPHLTRALSVMFRLRTAELQAAASLAALERTSGGVLLFAASGRVLFANAVARRLIDDVSWRGLSLSAEGRLCATNSLEDGRLQMALRTVLNPPVRQPRNFAQDVRISGPDGQERFTLQLSLLVESNPFACGPELPSAIGFLVDLQRGSQAAARVLAEVYGMTPAEVRVAQALGQGGSVEQVGAALGISANTVKTHIKHIYEKTAVNTRAGLTRLLISVQDQ